MKSSLEVKSYLPPLLPSPANKSVDREERQRKDYQSLADNIFRRNKKDSQLNGNRKSVGGASLASRVGITKVFYRSLEAFAERLTAPHSLRNDHSRIPPE